MSLKAMSIVWSAGLPDRSMKLCALALADWCNDEGISLHPSVAKVADRMSATRRTAQRTLHQMIENGLLEVTGNEFGGAPGTSRKYWLRLDKLAQLTGKNEHYEPETGDTGDTGDIHDTGDTGGRRRVTPVTETGDTGVTLSVIDPSIEPSVERERARKRPSSTRTRLAIEKLPDAWRDHCRERRPDLLAAQVFEKFRDHHTAKGTLMADWFAAWRTWIGRESEFNRRPPPTQGKYSATIAALTGRKSTPETFDVAATEVHSRSLGS